VAIVGEGMERIYCLFDQVPLPYDYVKFPGLGEPSAIRDETLFYYVNRVITGLSRRAFQHGGIDVSASINKWNFSWGRQFESERYEKCKSWQKVNHFAGAFLMGRKDHFHDRMKELEQRIGKVSFYPESYLLPRDLSLLEPVFQEHAVWIVKPAAAARGDGIKLVSSCSKVPAMRGVFQVYIERPLIITERKFDLRLYILVTSLDPMRIYIHENGMARFASHKYSAQIKKSDLKANLTNYSLNKDDKAFVVGKNGIEKMENSKWSFAFFLETLKSQGIDTISLVKDIEKVAVSAVVAGLYGIRPHHRKLIPHRHTSYELYGIDVLLDENYNPYIMEVNISPGMDASEAPLDRRIKEPLMHDTLCMARFIRCDCEAEDPCPGVDLVDENWRNSVTDGRREEVLEKNIDPWIHPVFADFVAVRDFIEEKRIKSGFRRIHPKRRTMNEVAKQCEFLEYLDKVFQSWIGKSNEERLALLLRNFQSYADVMKRISVEARKRLGSDIMENDGGGVKLTMAWAPMTGKNGLARSAVIKKPACGKVVKRAPGAKSVRATANPQ
jgi:tubulin polyglutamylase TTLL4